MSTGTEIIELIRKQAFLMQKTGLELGVVTNNDPLSIQIDNMDIDLSREFLLLSEKFTDHQIDISSGILNINATTTVESLHSHNVVTADINSGEVTVKNALTIGDKVIVMSMYNGQKYYVFDKVV